MSLLYDEEVKKFRRENVTARSVPLFDRVKSSLYEYRASKHPPLPKSFSSIEVPYRLTRTFLDHMFFLRLINFFLILIITRTFLSLYLDSALWPISNMPSILSPLPILLCGHISIIDRKNCPQSRGRHKRISLSSRRNCLYHLPFCIQ